MTTAEDEAKRRINQRRRRDATAKIANTLQDFDLASLEVLADALENERVTITLRPALRRF